MVSTVVLGEELDSVTFKVFSNLNGSTVCDSMKNKVWA